MENLTLKESVKLAMLAALKFDELQRAKDAEACWDHISTLNNQLKEYQAAMLDNSALLSLISRRYGFTHNGVRFSLDPFAVGLAVVCEPSSENTQIEQLRTAA